MRFRISHCCYRSAILQQLHTRFLLAQRWPGAVLVLSQRHIHCCVWYCHLHAGTDWLLPTKRRSIHHSALRTGHLHRHTRFSYVQRYKACSSSSFSSSSSSSSLCTSLTGALISSDCGTATFQNQSAQTTWYVCRLLPFLPLRFASLRLASLLPVSL